MRTVLSIAALGALAACATPTSEAPPPAVVDMPPPAAEAVVIPDAYTLAMTTVDELEAAGNEQQAIQRLVQLLGNPALDDAQKAKALNRLGDMRYGDGHNVYGAIEAWDELIENYPTSPEAIEAVPKRDIARGEATSLNGLIGSGELTPTKQFEAIFRLGEHQDAADFMLERNLTPENAYVLDMYQIGYLCDDDTLTGPAYDLTEPDGTMRVVRFCEFGK